MSTNCFTCLKFPCICAMTQSNLDKLERLLAEATPNNFGPPPWDYEAHLYSAIRNAAPALLEIVRVARRFVPPTETIQWEQREVELLEAFGKFDELKL